MRLGSLPSFSIRRQVPQQQLPAGGPQIRGHTAPSQFPEGIQVHHLQQPRTQISAFCSLQSTLSTCCKPFELGPLQHATGGTVFLLQPFLWPPMQELLLPAQTPFRCDHLPSFITP